MQLPRVTLLPVIVATIGLTAPADAQQAGRPDVGTFATPRTASPSWTLDFDYQTPRAIAVEDLAGQTRWYWYLPYTVTNQTGADRLFVPNATVYTDAGQMIDANVDIPPAVYRAIDAQLDNDLLEPPTQVVGEILQGPDYARESVIIWPHFNTDVDRFTLFVTGLSGETASVEVPGSDETELLRRTAALKFGSPGNYPINPQGQPIVDLGRDDVMR
ncbi:MAG: hypothetical protein AAF842_04310 [Planctomycetota bacterium]